MQGTLFAHSFHIPGTLTANLNIRFTVPKDCQLLHVSASNSAATNGTFILGTSTDDDAYLTTADIGDSNVPNEFDLEDFVNDAYPHIVDGTIFVITVDYDGAAGTAAANFTLILTFAEG
jgi:hypothetical protein